MNYDRLRKLSGIEPLNEAAKTIIFTDNTPPMLMADAIKLISDKDGADRIGDMRNATDSMWKIAVKVNPLVLSDYTGSDKAVFEIAVKNTSTRDMKELVTDTLFAAGKNIQLLVVKKSPELINYFDNIDPSALIISAKKNKSILDGFESKHSDPLDVSNFLKIVTDKQFETLLKINPNYNWYGVLDSGNIENVSDKRLIIAVKYDPEIIMYATNPSSTAVITALTYDPSLIDDLNDKWIDRDVKLFLAKSKPNPNQGSLF